MSQVNPGSQAAQHGVREGDLVTGINGETVEHLTNGEVQRLIKKSGPSISLELKSSGKRTGTGTHAYGKHIIHQVHTYLLYTYYSIMYVYGHPVDIDIY